MSEVNPKPFGLSDAQEADVAEYQAISGTAVFGLLLGILAPLALIHPLLWIVPGAGIFCSAIALRRIARDAPALIGRKAALVGLVLSVLFAGAAPANWFTYRHLVDREARQFALQWFEFLRRGEMLKSYQLQEPPRERLPLDDNLRERFLAAEEERSFLDMYTRRAEIRSLLALGEKTTVRYYDSVEQRHTGEGDVVKQIWAVTAEEAGRKTSYFLELKLRRYAASDLGQAYWQIVDFEGAVNPDDTGDGESGSQG